MNAIAILQALYNSEINISMSWCWDGGIDVGVDWGCFGHGDWRVKTVIHNDNGDAVALAVQFIVDEVLAQYPDSDFAKRWHSGEFSQC